MEGGGRRDDLQHTNYRIVAGMRGELSDGLVVRHVLSVRADQFRRDLYQRLLGHPPHPRDRRHRQSATRRASIRSAARSLNGTDPTCVPYDIFATGQVSQAALDYLQTPGFQRGTNQQTVASASLTGDLGAWGMKFPWAESGVGIAVGVEYRKESLELLTDAAFSLLPSSDLAGQGAPTLSTDGSFDVREAFAEVRIPIVEDGFIYNLSLEAGYRYSDYGIGGRSVSTDTYKIGARSLARSAISASAPPTTARSARRTSRSCSRRSASRSTAMAIPARASSDHAARRLPGDGRRRRA